MISVYSHKPTPRLRYLLDHVLTRYAGWAWQLVVDEEEFKATDGPKINYSNNGELPGLQMIPHGLLNDTGIKDIQPNPKGEGEATQIFVTGEDGQFDVFSAVFYCISRYEEYLPHLRDGHNRFEPSESWAFKQDVLQYPLVDIWLNRWLEKAGKVLGLQPKKRSFQFTATIDVDSCYLFKDKGLMRTMGALVRSLLSGEIEGFKDRLKVNTNRMRDPYDTFDYLNQLHHNRGIDLIYFYLVADYGLNDKNVSVAKRSFQQIIKSTGDYGKVALHPSYGAFDSLSKLRKEHHRLQSITHMDITHSRHHFLRVQLPDTYRKLQEIGIEHEHTMGYPSKLGFRASTATSFMYYDLDQEKSTQLEIHPFTLMEASLKYYKKLGPDEVMTQFKPLIDAVKKVNGHLITVWHSDAFSEYGDWKGWKQTYEQMLDYIADAST